MAGKIKDNSRGRTLLYVVGSLCLVIGTLAAMGIDGSGGESSGMVAWVVFGWAVTAFVFCLTFGAILGTLVDIRTLLAGRGDTQQDEVPRPTVTPTAGA